MTVLVADVGGTNTRLALVSDQGPHEVARFQNDRFGSFYEVLEGYLSGRDVPGLDGGCVAVAGPVTESGAQLTNRDWSFDVDRLSGLVRGARPLRLANDLVALGYALPALGADHLAEIRPARQAAANGQALVAGLGTGVNACLLGGGAVMEAELGHASMPDSIASGLRAEIGDAAGRFATNEDLFSGRGLARLYAAISGRDLPGPEILNRFAGGSDPEAAQTVRLTARLLGRFAREMTFMYLPFGGIHFAGGAARGILGSEALPEFLDAFNRPGRFDTILDKVPVRLITDDGAALIGAARYALA